MHIRLFLPQEDPILDVWGQKNVLPLKKYQNKTEIITLELSNPVNKYNLFTRGCTT